MLRERRVRRRHHGALRQHATAPLPADEVARLGALRQPAQDVVLGVWAPLLELSPAELDALVRVAHRRTCTCRTSPSTASDPGPDYGAWLRGAIPTATLEVWDGDGHYPHLRRTRSGSSTRLRAFESTLA